MKRLLGLLLWLQLLALHACSAPETPDVERAPRRVIWIAIDSLSAERLHFMGYPRQTSPWLDEFARESVVFDWALSPSNVTPRSVASYLTGRLHSQLQRDPFDLRLPAEATTLAEWFHANGFRTIGFNTNPLIVAGKGYAQGFERYHDLLPRDTPKATLGELIARLHALYEGGSEREFVYVHTMDVHHPYRPPPPDDTEFVSNEYRGEAVVDGNLLTPEGRLVHSNLAYFAESQDVSGEDIAYLLSQYEGSIRYSDRQLPLLLEALAFDPEQDLVVISADHGEQFFEHGYWLHGKTLMPEEIRVPLLVRWSGFPASRSDVPVSLVDLFPTFAELFSIESPPGLVGRSLLPALRGGRLAPRPVYSEAHATIAAGAAVVADGYLYWLCADNSRLTPWLEWPYFEVLCDLHQDAHCRRDLAIERPRITDRLNRLLRSSNPIWQAFTPAALRPGASASRLGPPLIGTGGPDSPGPELRGGSEIREYGMRMDEPQAMHLLSLEYRLASGRLEVSLVDRSSGRSNWRHSVRHAEPGWRVLRAKFRPEARLATLRIAIEGGAEVRRPNLRRLYGPDLPIVSSPEAAGFEPPEWPLSEEEAARLRVLGYLE